MSVKVDYAVFSLLDEVTPRRSGVLRTRSASVFECQSKACAPPPVGTGGSRSTGGSRARTEKRERLRETGGNKAVIKSLRGGESKAKSGGESKAKSGDESKAKGGGRVKATATEAIGAVKESMKRRFGTKDNPRGKGEKFPKATLPKQPPPKHFDTVAEAAEYLRKNPKANVTVPPGEVRTLIGKLKEMADAKIAELKAGGMSKEDAEKAGEINLCQVSVPGTNLFCNESYDIPRLKMPQFGSTAAPGAQVIKMHEDGVEGVTKSTKKDGTIEYNAQPLYEQHLKERGIKITEMEMPAEQLAASQVELKTTKVGGMADNPDFDPAGEAILVSRDGYIVDGHHRWGAQVVRDYLDGKGGDLKLKVKVIDMDILDILDDANNFADSIGLERKSA